MVHTSSWRDDTDAPCCRYPDAHLELTTSHSVQVISLDRWGSQWCPSWFSIISFFRRVIDIPSFAITYVTRCNIVHWAIPFWYSLSSQFTRVSRCIIHGHSSSSSFSCVTSYLVNWSSSTSSSSFFECHRKLPHPLILLNLLLLHLHTFHEIILLHLLHMRHQCCRPLKFRLLLLTWTLIDPPALVMEALIPLTMVVYLTSSTGTL